MNVLDASALLAFLLGEDGADAVEEVLPHESTCGAANWAEVAQTVKAHDRDWSLARSLLLSYGLTVTAVTIDDAEAAADRWRRQDGLSLGDRLSLALGDRLDATVLTVDSRWGGARVVHVR